jgi:hypothetical protein
MKQTRIDRKEAKSLYKEKTGRDISFNGLTYLAKENGFIVRAKDGFHYFFLKEKMLEYLNQINARLPAGFMTIQQLAEKYGKSYGFIYNVLKGSDYIEYGKRKVRAYKESDYVI